MPQTFINLIPDFGAFSTHNGNGKTPLFGDFSLVMGKIKLMVIEGEKINLLTSIREADTTYEKYGKNQRKRMVECECECGTVCYVKLTSFKNGHIKSCGCLVKQTRDKNTDQTKHGLYKHPLNYIWVSMRQRCYNENHPSYKRYGGRGIKVCDEWKDDFMAFYNWSMDNGWQKRLQIDRYPNKNGNYEPANCRVTTPKNNSNNRRDNVMVLVGNVEMPLSLACDKLGLKHTIIYQRMRRNGYNFKKAIRVE